MEGRVIKINLMAAIGVFILIIGLIVGIIVFVNRDKNNDKSEGKYHEKINENTDEYGEIDTTEEINIKGSNKKITMRTFKSKLGYKMNYDIDSFYYEQAQGVDIFESQVTETSKITVKKVTESFENKRKSLESNKGFVKTGNSTYRLGYNNIKNKMCYTEEFFIDNIWNKYYYIENGNEYFEIQVTYSADFEDTIGVISQKMIESFEVLK